MRCYSGKLLFNSTREFVRYVLDRSDTPLPMTELTGYDTTDRRYSDAMRRIQKMVDTGELDRTWNAAGLPLYAMA